jgi:Uma2 family endonuclease
MHEKTISPIVTPPSPAPTPTDAHDPFWRGWRDIIHKGPDGVVRVEQVPLTLEDILHPQEDDHVVHSNIHDQDCRYLGDVLQTRYADDARALVLVDCCVTWNDPVLGHHSPDIGVIFGVRKPRPIWTNFAVAVEGVRPIMLMEVTSKSTRDADLGDKVRDYHAARVPWYIVIDRERPEGPPRLIGFRFTPERYEKVPLAADGRLYLEPLGLWLGVRDNRVVLWDAATGQELGDYQSVVRALEAAELRQQQEAQARQAAEAQVAELQARLKELEAKLRPTTNGTTGTPPDGNQS